MKVLVRFDGRFRQGRGTVTSKETISEEKGTDLSFGGVGTDKRRYGDTSFDCV